MSVSHRVIGIIPARGGSKGVPRKNIRLLAGRPLIAYTFDAARNSQWLTKYVVTTDDAEIAQVASSLGGQVIMRPPELATDQSPMLAVILHTVETLQTAGEHYDIVLLLQPVAPLRTSSDIDACLELLATSKADSVVSVCEVPKHHHPEWQFLITDSGRLTLYNGQPFSALVSARQQLSTTFTRNGALYATWTSFLLENRLLLGPDTRAYQMPEERSINIDSEADLFLAEVMLSNRKNDAPHGQ